MQLLLLRHGLRRRCLEPRHGLLHGLLLLLLPRHLPGWKLLLLLLLLCA